MMIDTNVAEQAMIRETNDLLSAPGLFEVTEPEGNMFITNVRRIAGSGRERGQVLLTVMTALLVLLDAGVLYVSYQAQYRFINAMRGQQAASMIEAGMLDLALIIFSGLGIALSLKGKSSKTTRALIVCFAAASAGMNFAVANPGNWRSVAVYTAAPVVLAIVTDQVITVIRRYYLGKDEVSAWTFAGHAVRTLARFAVMILLYSLRTILAPPETFKGLRRMVLDAAPVPVIENQDQPLATPAPGTCLEKLANDLGEWFLCGNILPCGDHLPEVPPFDEEEWASYGQDRESETVTLAAAEELAADLIDAALNNVLTFDQDPADISSVLTHAGRCGARVSDTVFCTRGTPCEEHQAEKAPVFATKKEALIWHYRRHSDYGKRTAASKVASELAPLAGLQPGTGRTYIGDHLNELEAAARREIPSVNGSAP